MFKFDDQTKGILNAKMVIALFKNAVLIDSFVEKIVVQDDRYEWKLSCLSDIM